MSLGLYRDVLDEEAAYLLSYGEAKLVFAEDEEQVDKLLALADRVPQPQAYRLFRSARHAEIRRPAPDGSGESSPRWGATAPRASPAFTTGWSMRPAARMSRSSAPPRAPPRNPKLAMLAAGRVLRHCATYLAFDPKGPDDEYVSVLPLPWIMEQVYVLGKGLLCRMKVNFVEEPDTMMHDFREIAPTFVLFAPRVWESIAADVRAGVMDCLAAEAEAV